MDQVVGTFNLHSYLKVGTAVDVRGLLDGEQLFWWSKGDAPFGAAMIFVIQQHINNYNHCRADLRLTYHSTKTFAFLLIAFLCPPRC
ncbi:hypothetical protein J1N35_007560 [Gossypium stocksii]|uniref:Uncharacterized protein n=1 Tax=Gossypium stocksii TaxID=47602 RepID=A0A9D3W7S3_9ROSI|nr:hypothetical protein J1N35_007560 [Gossypium stocksii]